MSFFREYTSNHGFADYEWHHLLLKWDVTTGLWTFLVDNKGGLSSYGNSSANPFPGGHLILGQSQTISGALNDGKSLRADIMHFNMWEHVFSDEEALQIYSDCKVQLGTLVSWPEIQVRLHGDVKRVNFVRCRPEGTFVRVIISF